MTPIVIDTNVLLIADGIAAQMSNACRLECLEKLAQIKLEQCVVLDNAWIILGEYHNKLSPNRSPAPGSAFLKWLLQVLTVSRHVSQVTITPRDHPANTMFEEFPDDSSLENDFDPADRKFVAVANAHPEKPPILEAADSKWLGWESRLAAHGIRLEVLCRPELESIRKRKTS